MLQQWRTVRRVSPEEVLHDKDCSTRMFCKSANPSVPIQSTRQTSPASFPYLLPPLRYAAQKGSVPLTRTVDLES